jgi:hypothetical protein
MLTIPHPEFGLASLPTSWAVNVHTVRHAFLLPFPLSVLSIGMSDGTVKEWGERNSRKRAEIGLDAFA